MRLCSSGALRDADAARAANTPPTTGAQHGMILDVLLNDATGLTWVMSPAACGGTADGTTNVAYAVTNLSGGSAAITVTITFDLEEMAYRQMVAQPAVDTLAHFKAWAQGISGFLTSAGFVQTADTGQVNWSSIAAVPGAGTSVYEMWRFDDTLQATLPMFFNIYYGQQNSGYATIYITVGTGSDGTGNITTVSGSPLSSGVGVPQSPGGLGQSDLSADKNRVSLAIFCTGGSYGNGYWCVERSHDNTGADTADYIWFAWATQVQGGGALWQSKCCVGWSPNTWYECFAGITSISNGGA